MCVHLKHHGSKLQKLLYKAHSTFFVCKGKPHLLIPTHNMGVVNARPTLWLLFEAYSTVHFFKSFNFEGQL